MMSSIIALTLFYAFLSASFRGIISVIDRYQFGIGKHSVTFTNLYNNVVTLLFSASICLFFTEFRQIFQFVISIKVIVFSLILQLAAHAFSYAFRHMKVPSIIVFSKMADLFIPLFIFLFFSTWSTNDFIFSVSTFLVCLPVFLFQKKNGHIHVISAAAVCLALVVQGSLSPWFMADVSKNQTLWMPFTVALIFWRLIFSAIATLFDLKNFSIDSKISSRSKKYFTLMTLRAFLTFGAQAFLVLSLSYNKQVLAWPILNATGLISVVFSSAFLKEHPDKLEIMAIFLIILLGVVKILT